MNHGIKNILYPTDFSENAKHALPFALKLAKENNAKLHFLHSIEEPYDFAPMVENFKQNVTRKVEKLFEEIIEDIKEEKEYESLDVKSHLFEGRSVYSVLNATTEYDIDMVVMGTQGRSALERLFFGSTTSEVVQQSNVPVLVVPLHGEYTGFKKILFTSDYGPHDLNALKYVSKLASHHDSLLKIIHVTKKMDRKEDLMFRGLKDFVSENISYKKLKFELIESDDLLKTVNKEVNDHDFSLIVTVRYQNLFSVVGKKYSKEISQGTMAPLLVMPGIK
ncbi:MAG: universal stress protein [Gracilimonas sp.]|nr:universal stress protein [Gracilimonas sp.]